MKITAIFVIFLHFSHFVIGSDSRSLKKVDPSACVTTCFENCKKDLIIAWGPETKELCDVHCNEQCLKCMGKGMEKSYDFLTAECIDLEHTSENEVYERSHE